MKELSLHILDIAMNSVKAGASLIDIRLDEIGGMLMIQVADNGCGMDADFLARVTDPFTTSRTTRRVGMGIPLLKLAAEQAGGSFSIESQPGRGTTLAASFALGHLDKPPLGDITSTVVTLIQGAPEIDITYRHTAPQGEASLDTRVLRRELDGVPLNEPEVLAWILENLSEEEKGFAI